jgi:hypothetical protein
VGYDLRLEVGAQGGDDTVAGVGHGAQEQVQEGVPVRLGLGGEDLLQLIQDQEPGGAPGEQAVEEAGEGARVPAQVVGLVPGAQAPAPPVEENAVDQGQEGVAVERGRHGADHPVAAARDGLVDGAVRVGQGAPEPGLDQGRLAGAGGTTDDEKAPSRLGTQAADQVQSLRLAAEAEAGEFGILAPVVSHEPGVRGASDLDPWAQVAAEEAGEDGDALGGVAVAVLPTAADLAHQGADRVSAVRQGLVVEPVQPGRQFGGDGERLAGVVEVGQGEVALEGELQEGPPVALRLPPGQAREQVAQGLGHRQIGRTGRRHGGRLLAGSP